MKTTLFQRAGFLTLVGVMVGGIPVTPAMGLPFSDFDDGTLQGWTQVEEFLGTLTVEPTGGNPGGWLFVTDLASGGALKVRGPSAFSGDLSVYTGISWDEFIITHPGEDNTSATVPVLWGTDGSQYRYYGEQGPLDVWRDRYVSFDPAGWVQWYGPSSFTEVLQDATLGFELAVTNGLGPEAGLDNIRLVPEPSMGLLCLAGLVLVARRRRVA
ncbi:MAG: hypothetical protein JXB13_05450 [Phycisphaerae bacterium]|nr:hypothetical protein [Phycisphaerae bacterium]